MLTAVLTPGVEAAELRTVIVEGETVDTVVPEDNTDTENYSPSLGRNISFYFYFFTLSLDIDIQIQLSSCFKKTLK